MMSSKIRKAVFFVLLLGVTFLSYEYTIKPASKGLTEQKTRVNEKLAKLAEITKVTVATEDLNKQIGQLEEAIDFFESKLPHKSEVHKVLEHVTIIAQQRCLTPKTIRTLARKNNSGYIEQPLQMELSGDFNSFYSFLLELEKLPRIMKIRELKLKRQGKSEGQIAANFVVSIFFQNKISVEQSGGKHS